MSSIGSDIFTQEFPQGAEIFREGEPGDCAFIIESGSVEISMQHLGERMVLSRFGEGELFGEMAVIDDGARTATAVALQDTILVAITRNQINEHLNHGDSVVNLLLQVILKRYRSHLERYNDGTISVVSPTRSPNLNVSTVQLEPATKKPAEAAIEAIRLEADIRNGIDRQEFVVFYQPIVDIQSRIIAGFEALVRWNHPKRGLLSPFHFIDLTEKTGLVIPLGDYVLERACFDLPKLIESSRLSIESGENLLPFVSVNVSGRQIKRPVYLDTIRETLRMTGANPAQIKLEITESLFMDDPDIAVNWIDECRAMGLTIALDDFGTGFSSLGYLYQFSIDNLKIDRCFVTAMSENERAMKVVRAIAGLAQGLHLNVVAEGIEEPEQIIALNSLGCHLGQGYVFAKPMALADMCEYLESQPDWWFGQR